MLKRSHISLTVFFVGLFSVFAVAQTTIEEKIERKISLSPYVGVVLFPNNLVLNDLGLPKNLFTGYGPAPVVGVGAYYKLNNRINLGADASFLFTGRDVNGMNIIGLSAVAKLYPISSKKRVSPYIILGMNLSLVNINQQKQLVTVTPQDTALVGTGINATGVDYGFNQLNMYMAPVFGPVGGMGVDVKINRKISVFLQGSLQASVGSNSLIKENFPDNESLLQYVAIKGGVNIKLFKKMQFEIDTEAVRIPDVIALLSPPELEDEHQQLLSREGNFAVNIREGLRHNVKIGTSSSIISIQVEQEGSPCKILAILYDQFGNKIAETELDASGNVNFSGLEKGNYDVAMEVQPPCQSSNISYVVSDPNNTILSQGNEEYVAKTDSLAYNIEGFVDFKDDNISAQGVQVMLVDQDNKQVKAKQLTGSQGDFSFKIVAPGNYKVVYEVPSAKVQSRIAYSIKDTKDKLVKQENFPFNDIQSKPKEGTRLMSGKLDLNDPSIPAYKLSLDLVDHYNRVIDHSIPNDDGSFEFIDRKSEHNDVVLDIADKNLEKQLSNTSASTKSPLASRNLVRSISYEPKIEESKKMEDLLNASHNASSTSKPIPGAKAVNETSEMELYTLYNAEGVPSQKEGVGFQVGSFRNLENVYHLMDKLKKEGFEVYVQPVMSDDMNTRFKMSQNYKLNRIIVFASGTEQHINDIKQKLVAEGYPIVVKEHFKPGVNLPQSVLKKQAAEQKAKEPVDDKK